MKKIKLLSATALMTVSLNLQAQDLDGTTLTLSDIKEALYGLLQDSKENRKDINAIFNDNKNTSSATTSYRASMDKNATMRDAKIENNRKNIQSNSNQIFQNKIQISKNSQNIHALQKQVQKIENERILYKEEIENFIKDNKELLPTPRG